MNRKLHTLMGTCLALAAFLAGQSRKQLNALATARDIPLHTLGH